MVSGRLCFQINRSSRHLMGLQKFISHVLRKFKWFGKYSVMPSCSVDKNSYHYLTSRSRFSRARLFFKTMFRFWGIPFISENISSFRGLHRGQYSFKKCYKVFFYTHPGSSDHFSDPGIFSWGVPIRDCWLPSTNHEMMVIIKKIKKTAEIGDHYIWSWDLTHIFFLRHLARIHIMGLRCIISSSSPSFFSSFAWNGTYPTHLISSHLTYIILFVCRSRYFFSVAVSLPARYCLLLFSFYSPFLFLVFFHNHHYVLL